MEHGRYSTKSWQSAAQNWVLVWIGAKSVSPTWFPLYLSSPALHNQMYWWSPHADSSLPGSKWQEAVISVQCIWTWPTLLGSVSCGSHPSIWSLVSPPGFFINQNLSGPQIHWGRFWCLYSCEVLAELACCAGFILGLSVCLSSSILGGRSLNSICLHCWELQF